MDSVSRLSESHRSDRKRRRIEKACETCRRRKERCDGASPRCSNCQAAGRDCVYSSESRKRGLPEGWVRALEKFWALAILHAPGIDQKVITAVEEGLRNSAKDDFAGRWTDEVHERGYWRIWKGSRLPQGLERLLPCLERLPQQKMTENSLNDPVSSSTEEGAASAAFRGAASGFDSAADHLPATPTAPDRGYAPAASPIAMALPADALRAIDSYFTFTYVWFPMAEKHRVYRTYHKWSDAETEVSSGDRACLLAVLAYNEVQRHGDVVDISASVEADGASRVKSLITRIRRLIPDGYQKCQLSHIQALLILSLAQLVACFWDDAWLLVGQATRLALLERTTAAHVNTTSNSASRPGESQLTQVLAGCFIFDTLISAVAALPSHLRDADLSGLKHLDEDSIEEWTPLPQSYTDRTAFSGPAYALSTFNGLLDITKHLSRVSPKAWSSSASLDKLQAVRRELLTSEKMSPARSRSSQAIAPAIQGVLLPHEVTVQLLRYTTLIVVEVRSAGLVFEPTVMSYEISSCLEQATDLLMKHTLALDSQAIPPIWQLILGTIMNEIEKARSLLRFNVPSGFFQALETITSTASTRWPCFDSLHTRILSSIRRHAFLNESASHAMPQQSQSLVRQDNGGPNTTPQSVNIPTSDLFSLNEAALVGQGHESTHYSSERVFDSMETAGMSDSVSSIPDFVTMDALNW